ncbi:protein of unknown function [Aminobacter niigataensis]|nr:protein of unknown function [Aminobacter niigataensis]
MAAGVVYAPGTMVFCIQTLSVFGPTGQGAYFYQTALWLPPDLRETTPTNAKFVMEMLRTLDPEARSRIDEVLARARDPRSRKDALRVGARERFYSQHEADELLRRPNLPE